MPELDNLIRAWRQEMSRAGIRNPEALDELESHLREQTALLVRSGLTEEAAFQNAVSRLGHANILRHEFNKLEHVTRRPAKIALATFGLVMLAVAAFGSDRISSQHWSSLFAVHVFTLTAGYLAAFIGGILGIFQVLNRSFSSTNFLGENALRRTLFWLNGMAVALMGVGIVSGMAWAQGHLGHYLDADEKGLASICVWAWLVATLALQGRGRVDVQDLSLAAIAGNLMFGLCWFGTGIMANLRSHEQGSYGWFWAFVWAHLFLLLLGICFRNETHVREA